MTQEEADLMATMPTIEVILSWERLSSTYTSRYGSEHAWGRAREVSLECEDTEYGTWRPLPIPPLVSDGADWRIIPQQYLPAHVLDYPRVARGYLEWPMRKLEPDPACRGLTRGQNGPEGKESHMSVFNGTYQVENGVGDTLAIVHLPVDAALACAVALATHREGTVHVYNGNELIALVRADGSIKKLQQKATGTET